MITKLRIQNFKALRDVEIALTPIHVLIGPNDSGKTSILDALAALCRSVDHELADAFAGSWKGTELVWSGQHDLPVTIDVVLQDGPISSYAIGVVFREGDRRAGLKRELLRKGDEELKYEYPSGPYGRATEVYNSMSPGLQGPNGGDLRSVGGFLKGVHFYQWDPRFLALPVAPDTKRSFRMESNGFGLALCLDEILNFDRDRFIALERRFSEIFPHITSIKLIQEMAYRAPVDAPDQVTILQKTDGKGLYFKLSTVDELVPASQVSDGMLLVLAYLAILYLPEPPRALLVEEPENGIHPKRLRDVMNVLRDLVREQSHMQVVLTTHSPYALDLFKPEEVTLCTKLDNGEVKTTRLSESPAIRKRIDVFTLGEIWTSEGDEAIAESKDRVEGATE